MYNALSLLSIASFWGEDVTDDQLVWLDIEVCKLSLAEQSKYLDLTPIK